MTKCLKLYKVRASSVLKPGASLDNQYNNFSFYVAAFSTASLIQEFGSGLKVAQRLGFPIEGWESFEIQSILLQDVVLNLESYDYT